uniref:Ubinuclein-2-like n=1 Tax=Takifugu rubripes TaxID=31033 RepID=A0A674NUM8_TAKRU
MAEPRKVPFVTISSFNNSSLIQDLTKKRRHEDEAIDISFGIVGGAVLGSAGGGGGLFGNIKRDETEMDKPKPTVRLILPLSEPNERASSEFNYRDLVHSTFVQVKLAGSKVPIGLAPLLDPSDPLADEDRERCEIEKMARNFENKFDGGTKKKKGDRIQDLIDIGYGYDESDPFIDNSEAYDELVPASLNTKYGGFYINTGTLQFRAASDSEGENTGINACHFKGIKDCEERVLKKLRKKQDGGILEDKKPRKNKLSKPGHSALNLHRPEKKKRKKLMKDSIHLANMLRRFTREKEETRKKNLVEVGLPRPATRTPNTNDIMDDLDFEMLDSPQPPSPVHAENYSFGMGTKTGSSRVSQGNMVTPPLLPTGLPGPLIKRIDDLRAASRQFDEEGRKKFFTLDMNNILLDIELQVQEQPAEVRSVVYSHMEAFVPCNKEALLKRLKKLSLNIQDDRLRTPLLKLKLAVCSVMPEQMARYNMDCIAKVAKQQSGEGERNGSEDDDEEKPGKRMIGPRKKFAWDEKLRSLLCNLVRVKLGFYELESKKSQSVEDYLKAFMETEVKPLWPKGWMQARMLFKESITAHGHLTGYIVKKKIVPTAKTKSKESHWVQRSAPSPLPQAVILPPRSPSEPKCLDSLKEELVATSLDSISQALAILGNTAKGLAHGDSPVSPEEPKTVINPSALHASPILQQKNAVSASSSAIPHPVSGSTSVSSTSTLSRPSMVSSLLQPLRVERLGAIKGSLQAINKNSVLNTQRNLGVTKANLPATSLPSKPRPPPTASPLIPPGTKMGLCSPISSFGKGYNNNKANTKTLIITSLQSRPHTLPSSQMTPKTFQAQCFSQISQNKSSPVSQKITEIHPQSNFITPMQVTLTKSSHSSIQPIVKLTPRATNPTVSISTSVSPSVSQSPRSQVTTSVHQYSTKNPTGFHSPFSGTQGGATKLGQGSYTTLAGQKPSNQNSSINTSLMKTLTLSKHSGPSSSPTLASSNPGQPQKPGSGATQGKKPVASMPSSAVSSQLSQVSTDRGGSVPGSATSVPLGFEIPGHLPGVGLVPVSLSFQYPQLLNLPSLGATGSTTVASSSATSTNSPFSILTQNLYKNLQTGSQISLPPHLQLPFSGKTSSFTLITASKLY